jgi:hypothetical protein
MWVHSKFCNFWTQHCLEAVYIPENPQRSWEYKNRFTWVFWWFPKYSCERFVRLLLSLDKSLISLYIVYIFMPQVRSYAEASINPLPRACVWQKKRLAAARTFRIWPCSISLRGRSSGQYGHAADTAAPALRRFCVVDDVVISFGGQRWWQICAPSCARGGQIWFRSRQVRQVRYAWSRGGGVPRWTQKPSQIWRTYSEHCVPQPPRTCESVVGKITPKRRFSAIYLNIPY